MRAKTYRNGARALVVGLALTLPTGLIAESGQGGGILTPAAPGSVGAAQAASADPRSPAPIRVKVKNDGFEDVNVYTVISQAPFYLGHVTGLSEQTFEFPKGSQSSGSVQFLVDPVAGFGYYLTERLWLTPGDVVDLRAADNLRFSTVTIEARGEGGQADGA